MPVLHPSRRSLLQGSVMTGATLLASTATRAVASPQLHLGKSPLTQPPLPFAENALEPMISARTIGIHYGKHHKAYFDHLNAAIAGTPLAAMSLEAIVQKTAGDPAQVKIFHNAAQAFNHNFYWESLTPKHATPSRALKHAITRDFGSLEDLKKKLSSVAAGQFGSGWGWLVLDDGKLKVVSTSNADVPFVHGQTPLLTVDVWEHAYYLDYQNRRPDYLNAVINKAMNWSFASKNFRNA